MKINRSTSSLVAAAALALAGLGLVGSAQADNVYWSVGVSSPGVQLGVANAPPMVMMPQPVYMQAQPVYMQPQPMYVAPRPVVYMQPAPVYMAPPQYIRADWQRPGPDYGRGWRHGRGHHEYERFEGGRSERGHGGYRRD